VFPLEGGRGKGNPSETEYTMLLKGFADENFECKVYTFLKPNQEQLREMDELPVRRPPLFCAANCPLAIP
jgi:hypothetical protein